MRNQTYERKIIQVNVLDCIHRRKGMFEMPWSRYWIRDEASGGGNSRCTMNLIRWFLSDSPRYIQVTRRRSMSFSPRYFHVVYLDMCDAISL